MTLKYFLYDEVCQIGDSQLFYFKWHGILFFIYSDREFNSEYDRVIKR